MAQVLAPGLVVVEGDMPCFPKHTIRASTSCGFPSGTLTKCVYDRPMGLKRMLANCVEMHFKLMVATVLRRVGKGGAKSTRDTSLDCPEVGRDMLHASTAGSGVTRTFYTDLGCFLHNSVSWVYPTWILVYFRCIPKLRIHPGIH